MEDKDKRSHENGQTEEPYTPSVFANVFQSFYDRFRGVPLRYFDIFIGLCIAAIVILVIVGVLQARGIL